MDEERLDDIERKREAAIVAGWRHPSRSLDALVFEDLPALLAEVRRLREEAEDYRAGADAEAHAHDEARAEVERLAVENTRLRVALREIADYATAYHQPVLNDVRRIAKAALAFDEDA